MRSTTLAIAALVLLVNFVAWAAFNQPAYEPNWTGTIKGVSFSPYQPDQNPFKQRFPSSEEIDGDLALLADKVKKVRTYTSLDGFEKVPALAEKHGLTVTAGAWVDKRRARNDQEIDNLIANARTHRNIDRVIVGNEAVLRGDLSVAELAVYLQRVKRAVKVPVGTAEPWHVWVDHPELAKHVDFIGIHILPYWEGIKSEEAMQFVIDRYNDVKRAHPNKPILIAEAGWPSAGNRMKFSEPSLISEARFVRQFLNLAQQRGWDYFIMEAFDQPWKTAIEGEAGAHWGLFKKDRTPKFPLVGPVVENSYWQLQAGLAAAFALAPMLWFLTKWKTMPTRGRLFYAVALQIAASLIAWTLFLPETQGLGTAGKIAWGVLLPAQVALLIVMLVNALEFAEMKWTQNFRRRFPALLGFRNDATLPKVSLHLAICKEPAELVIQTLDSLAALDYPNFEVIVVDNNTPDPAMWEPVKAHCEKLGAHFRFFSLGKWPGFKAGALNFALKQTSPDAEVIGVIDSDYVVRPDWLRATVPYFQNNKVGYVQAPQDHREWQHSRFHEMLNWEYAGFFHIGMVHRNERDAIVQHGTMTLIRRSALSEVGGWSEWCICEDTELGLRLIKQGYESVYVNTAFGRGLTPHTFSGYKGQRFRWVFGAVQILRAHWRSLLPWNKNPLTLAQRYHFATGWLSWFADAMHLVFTMAAIVWTFGLVAFPQYFDFPLAAFLIPTIGMFAFKIMHTALLYKQHVPCTPRQRWAAAVAGMSLTHAIARGIFTGIFTSSQPFLRTPKAENKPALVRGLAMAREETLMMAGLWVAAAAIAIRYGITEAGMWLEDPILWIGVLLVQSLPYIAALYSGIINVLPTNVPVPSTKPAVIAPEPIPAGAAQPSPAYPGAPSPRKAA